MPDPRRYTLRIFPNKTQTKLLWQYVDARWFVWNWALETLEKKRQDALKLDPESKPKNDWNALYRDFTVLRHGTSGLSRLYCHDTRSAINDLKQAYKNFFARVKKNKKGPNPKNPFGFPQPKKRFDIVHGFKFERCKVIGRRLKAIGTDLKLERDIPIKGRVSEEVAVKYHAGKWYASFVVYPDLVTPETIEPTDPDGLDIGIRKYATLSDGVMYENPNWTKKYSRKLAHAQRKQSRQKKGSNRYRKTVQRVAKIHAGMKNRRHHYGHLVSKQVADTYNSLCIETHSLVKQMSGRLAKHVADVGQGHFRQCLEYKFADRGKTLFKADEYFPSSQICHVCGYRNHALGSEEKWVCPGCGAKHDRDTNASKTLQLEGRRQLMANQLEKTVCSLV
jgi:putative transposase